MTTRLGEGSTSRGGPFALPTIGEVMLEHAAPTAERYRADPVAWAGDKLGLHLWSKQREILQSVRDNRKTAVQSCHEVGKAVPLDTPIPSPLGWTTMGELQVGDAVFDERGQPCSVTSISPTWELPCYEIVFSDGARQIVNEAHEWNVLDIKHRRRYVTDWRDHWDDTHVHETGHLAKNLMENGQRRWRIPVTRPLALPEADLPIHPYVMGAWLGDGTSIRPEITIHENDIEIIDRIRSLGENVRRRPKSKYAWTMTGENANGQLLLTRLRSVGVLGNKHIPITYLRASYAQRLELMRGLMDTDGFNGTAVGIDLCNQRLAYDVAELVRSLGWIVRMRQGPTTFGGVRYRLAFRADVCPFSLSRKVAAWKPPRSSAPTVRSIASISPIGVIPTRCIEVDSPRHLYLVGTHFIPTHNSFCAATAVAHWIATHPPGEAFAVTTAPTGPQVAAILWREINRMHSTGNLPGRMNLTEWYIGHELVALGRKPSDYNRHAFQGIHAPFLLIVFDEACGITKSMWDAASTLAANENSHWLAIGNPDDANTEFGAVCKPGSDWNVIKIGYEDTPNFTGEPVPQRLADSLIHPIWVQDRKAHWGEESALFQSKCQGIFPLIGDPYQVIPYAWLSACRYLELPARGDIEAGIDVGAGGDRTMIWIRQGPRALASYTFIDSDPMRQVGNIAAVLRERQVRRAKVDVIGVGWALTGRLRELSSRSNPYGREHTHDAEVIGVNVSEDPPPGTIDPGRFVNLRAWLWWEIGREQSRLQSWDLSEVDDDTLHELQIPKYKIVDSAGRIQIESRNDIVKRLGQSPDSASALLLAYMPGTAEGSSPPSGVMDRDLLSGTSPRDLTGERGW